MEPEYQFLQTPEDFLELHRMRMQGFKWAIAIIALAAIIIWLAQ